MPFLAPLSCVDGERNYAMMCVNVSPAPAHLSSSYHLHLCFYITLQTQGRWEYVLCWFSVFAKVLEICYLFQAFFCQKRRRRDEKIQIVWSIYMIVLYSEMEFATERESFCAFSPSLHHWNWLIFICMPLHGPHYTLWINVLSLSYISIRIMKLRV